MNIHNNSSINRPYHTRSPEKSNDWKYLLAGAISAPVFYFFVLVLFFL